MAAKMFLGFACAVFWFLASISAAGAAGDPEAGKKKFYTCMGCHSISGATNSYPTYHVPRLGGQHADYIVAALQAYKGKQRRHASMYGNSATMSDQDMQDIAAYVAKFRGMNVDLPVTGSASAGKQKAEACASCHGADGNSEDGSYPRLAGQYETYLVKALQDYKAGIRGNAIMAAFAGGLNEEDIKDVAAFYASQKKGLTLPQD